ncbi:MAG: serine/threonine protein kinase [Kofleriaceae bacterium]
MGSILDERYRVDAKIAEGGFGSIYRATHVASGLDVALKVLHADLACDSSLATRFRREAACLERLHDPHTVACYEVGEAADGTLYIAMELLVGQSLHDRMLARGRLGWRTALSIVRDACSSLAEAHELGIVHRDLKPANLHLGANDYVKVLDFGIARITNSEVDDGNELTRMGQMIGTLEYMAPEQVLGGACDSRSDIYQLGILTYEMITGRRPFAGASNPTSLITALLTQTPPAPSTMLCGSCLPQEVDRLILRCLEREPEHRFASVHRLVDAIDAALLLSDAQPAMRNLDSDDEAPTWIANSHSKSSTMAPARTTVGPRVEPAAMPAFEVPVRPIATPTPDRGYAAMSADVITPEYLRHIPTLPSTELLAPEPTEVVTAPKKFPSGERRLAAGTSSPVAYGHETIATNATEQFPAQFPSNVEPIMPERAKRGSGPALPGLPPVRESSGNLALADLASAMSEQRVAKGSSTDIAADAELASTRDSRREKRGPNSDQIVSQLVYPLASERPRRDTPPSETPIARPRMSFGARIALWTASLALGGAAVGALIASLVS